MKTLGILGGMGPSASIRFYEHVIALSRSRHGARANGDYPHLLLSNLPVPDLIGGLEGEKIAVSMLRTEMQRLADAGAQTLVLACNTMHLFADACAEGCGAEFLSMVDLVVRRVAIDGRKTVGVLGSPTTLRSPLYRAPLERKGLAVLIPSTGDVPRLERLIRRVIAGECGKREQEALRRQVLALKSRGAEAVILGCTELPLVAETMRLPLPIYDSLRVLAEAACDAIYTKSPGSGAVRGRRR